ncbi:unnamed protein product [Cylindrotheca closterium]|uniref:Uncharacterized protein n=1 Tax=Cylindrotheca closterium TaxID=2856 RepID=A0AAD2G0Z0_9STRA|nr:unnamed protein product [Cylindrotheca closterium]
MMENIESWARTAYGYRGIRLDYIFRENSEVPVVGDPGFLRADDGSRSIEEELVRRAAHTGAVFRRNNQKFWVMLHAVTHETDAYNHVRQFAPSLNGRLLTSLCLHNIVEGNISLSVSLQHFTGTVKLEASLGILLSAFTLCRPTTCQQRGGK